jgi:hypothetical protein
MDEYASLSHTKWDCKYHIVFILKCRRKVLYKTLRQHLGEVFRDLAQKRECKIEKGHLMWIMCQVQPRQFLALFKDGPRGFLVAAEEVRSVVPLIDPLHELVAKPLRLALTGTWLFTQVFVRL